MMNRKSGKQILILIAASALTALPCAAAKNRAVWFWASSSSPYGSANIVGNPVSENQTLDFFNGRGIKKVYGSYQNRPVSEAAVIAAWNAKLDAEGIESQFLMSENTWIYPVNHASFLDKITERLINFNAGRPAAEQFDGLHLDIEPQALTEFKDGTPTEKRDYLNLLRDTYAAVRTHFVTNGFPDFPVYADLPVWFDSSSSIGWTGTAERDAWFDAISTNLTGVSLMPFDRGTFSNIDSGVSWERANITNATVRVGLESDIGSGGTWPTSLDFNAMMETLETNYGTDEATDIQAYAIWRQALFDEAFGSVGVDIHAIPGTKQAELEFNTQTNTTYAILHTLNLCNWQEIARFRAPHAFTTNFPVSTDAPFGYWKIQHLIPLQ
ncbi:hypothetical protein P4B35_17750 [Pontiellaceae bacterium B12227]|nr:hypothetical protein [Pontiellaceae bacterium B12227]